LTLESVRLLSKTQETARSFANRLAKVSDALKQPLLNIQRSTDHLLLAPGDPAGVRREAKLIQRCEEQISSAVEELLEEQGANLKDPADHVPVLVSEVLTQAIPIEQLKLRGLSAVKILADRSALEEALKKLLNSLQKLSKETVRLESRELSTGVEILFSGRSESSLSTLLELERDAAVARARLILEANQGRVSSEVTSRGGIELRVLFPAFRPS
jgi:hypothetical protein